MIYYNEIEFAQELEISAWVVKKHRNNGEFPKPDSCIKRSGPNTPLWSKPIVDKFKEEYKKKESHKVDKEEFKRLAVTLNRQQIARRMGLPITRVDSFARWHKIIMFGSKPNFPKPEIKDRWSLWLKSHVNCLTNRGYSYE